jgi:hypothetical protein
MLLSVVFVVLINYMCSYVFLIWCLLLPRSPFGVAILERKKARRYSLHLFTVLKTLVLIPMEGSVIAVMIAMSWILYFMGDHCGVMSMVVSHVCKYSHETVTHLGQSMSDL